MNDIIAPMGRIIGGAISFASASASISSSAPQTAEPGTRKRWSLPTKKRMTCGAMRPTKLIMPTNDTATAADLVFEAGEFSRFRNARSFAAWVGLTPSEHSSGESDRRGAITKAGNKHLRKTLVEAAWHYLTCSGRPKDLAKGQAPDRVARRHAAKGVRRLVERREAPLARGVHGSKANVATARELACWVWAVGLMAEEA